jgi:sugar/nucleoside kinase (ribokinase family)
MKILVAGELNPDIIFSGLTAFPRPGREVLAERLSLQLGSSSAIFAAGLAKLGNEVSFVGRVGDDYLGRFSLGELARFGVDVACVIVDPGQATGVTVSISGEDRALLTFPGAIAALSASDVDDEALRGSRHLHVASFYLQRSLRPGLPELFARARARGLTTSLDPGCDPAGTWAPEEVRRLLALVDVFLPDEIELAALAEVPGVEAGLRRLANGRTAIAAKLGERGCAALEGESLVRLPALAVEAVDTTGAGDSFDAGFLHAWLRGRALEDCLRCGTICGGLSTRGLGGASSQPGWEEVEHNWERVREERMVAGCR